MIRINGVPYSWTSCSFRWNGIPFGEGVQSFDYEQTRERKIVYGSRKDGTPIGKTAGKYSVAPLTLKMLRSHATIWKSALSPLGLLSYGDADFVLSLQLFEPVPGAVPSVMTFAGCTIDGEKGSQAEGTDELVTEFTIGCLEMTENGVLTLASRVRGILP